ncbi:MAG: phage tail tape measure protein, partial [Deltaproteobacteria bacterium HGW-Deltaproteobacteria-7]
MKNSVEIILYGDSSKLERVLGRAGRSVKTFGSTARAEFNRIKNAASSLEGKLASLGISLGAIAIIKQSAQLDQSLTRIGQTAGEGKAKVAGLRAELWRMSAETGEKIENLQQGFNSAVQAGLNFKEALPVIDAVNKAAAVSGASADSLTASLTVMSSVFGFDLSKPKEAERLLDKMRVAGKVGSAEMEHLANEFPRIGFSAKRAGMNVDQTLGFLETLSQAEKNSERRATLAASWLRLFTTPGYMKKATAATGVRFFDSKGTRRDAMTVFEDIKTKYDKLKTDAQRQSFIGKFLEGADTETITASVALLQGNFLKKGREFTKAIENSSGTIAK